MKRPRPPGFDETSSWAESSSTPKTVCTSENHSDYDEWRQSYLGGSSAFALKSTRSVVIVQDLAAGSDENGDNSEELLEESAGNHGLDSILILGSGKGSFFRSVDEEENDDTDFWGAQQWRFSPDRNSINAGGDAMHYTMDKSILPAGYTPSMPCSESCPILLNGECTFTDDSVWTGYDEEGGQDNDRLSSRYSDSYWLRKFGQWRFVVPSSKETSSQTSSARPEPPCSLVPAASAARSDRCQSATDTARDLLSVNDVHTTSEGQSSACGASESNSSPQELNEGYFSEMLWSGKCDQKLPPSLVHGSFDGGSKKRELPFDARVMPETNTGSSTVPSTTDACLVGEGLGAVTGSSKFTLSPVDLTRRWSDLSDVLVLPLSSSCYEELRHNSASQRVVSSAISCDASKSESIPPPVFDDNKRSASQPENTSANSRMGTGRKLKGLSGLVLEKFDGTAEAQNVACSSSDRRAISKLLSIPTNKSNADCDAVKVSTFRGVESSQKFLGLECEKNIVQCSRAITTPCRTAAPSLIAPLHLVTPSREVARSASVSTKKEPTSSDVVVPDVMQDLETTRAEQRGSLLTEDPLGSLQAPQEESNALCTVQSLLHTGRSLSMKDSERSGSLVLSLNMVGKNVAGSQPGLTKKITEENCRLAEPVEAQQELTSRGMQSRSSAARQSVSLSTKSDNMTGSASLHKRHLFTSCNSPRASCFSFDRAARPEDGMREQRPEVTAFRIKRLGNALDEQRSSVGVAASTYPSLSLVTHKIFRDQGLRSPAEAHRSQCVEPRAMRAGQSSDNAVGGRMHLKTPFSQTAEKLPHVTYSLTSPKRPTANGFPRRAEFIWPYEHVATSIHSLKKQQKIESSAARHLKLSRKARRRAFSDSSLRDLHKMRSCHRCSCDRHHYCRLQRNSTRVLHGPWQCATWHNAITLATKFYRRTCDVLQQVFLQRA